MKLITFLMGIFVLVAILTVQIRAGPEPMPNDINGEIDDEIIQGRQNLTTVTRRAVGAQCQTDLVQVELELSEQIYPKGFTGYYPKCTRVKRCSGCCTDHLLSCEPTKIVKTQFTVDAYCLVGRRKVPCQLLNTELVDEHEGCECVCRIKPEDCNKDQIHRGCQCHCINAVDQIDCSALEDKTWDPDTCKCVCVNDRPCATGLYFDKELCQCIVSPDVEFR